MPPVEGESSHALITYPVVDGRAPRERLCSAVRRHDDTVISVESVSGRDRASCVLLWHPLPLRLRVLLLLLPLPLLPLLLLLLPLLLRLLLLSRIIC